MNYIYSIKRRPRLNVADSSKITNKRRPGINTALNQKNAAFIWGLEIGNLHHPDNYICISSKEWQWNFNIFLVYKQFKNDLS